MRIGIVCRFYPPDQAPTGIEARTLATVLARHLPDAAVTVFTTRAVYAPASGPLGVGRDAAVDEPVQTPGGGSPVRVDRVRTLYTGKSPLPRLAASLIDGARLAGRAARGSDLMIALTDPPFLPLWVEAAARRYRCRWAEWAMDLYPDVLAATGVMDEGHPLYRWLERRAARLAPAFRICLGPGQRAYLDARRGRATPTIVLPTGLCPPAGPGEPAAPYGPGPGGSGRGRPVVVCAGNYGAVHPPIALTALIERADARRLGFVLALYGSHAAALRRRFAGHPAVTWRDRLDRAELEGAAAHVVALSGAATHLSVPSRALSAVSLGCPVIFLGRPEADTWRMLAEGPVAAGWLIPERPDGGYRAADIDRALTGLADPAERARRVTAARQLAATLGQARAAALVEIVRHAGGPGGSPDRPLWDVP